MPSTFPVQGDPVDRSPLSVRVDAQIGLDALLTVLDLAQRAAFPL